MYLLSYFISLLLLELGIIKTITNARFTENYSINQQEQLSRINNYEIVQPYRLQGRNRRDMSTLTEDGHLKSTTFVIPGTDRQFILDINLNENLFPDSYVIISDRPDGQTVTKKPHSKHHCYYHGTVRNTNSSSVAIDTCSGISGVIVTDSETFYIEPFKDSESDHLIYKPQDVQWKKKFFDDSEIYKRPDGEEYLQNPHALPRHKRDVFTETKYIELVIVADNAEFLLRDGSVKNTEERCKQVANIMDMTYKPLNVRVALASVVVWNIADKIIFDSDPGKTMSLFQTWRKDELKIKNDNAQLMTGNDFEGSTVGMASLGGMCSIEKSAGVNEDHATEAAGVASTMCHEMGHNMGFYHDEENCVCSEEREGVGCIMGPVASSTPPTVWSECTKENLRTALEKGLASCLFNYPAVIFDGPICGNGYVEKGEQCDCGAVEHCDNDCCVAETCTLHENATCAVGECCENCHLKAAGYECREMVNECDLPEYCTGHSNECPANVYRQNGETCMNRAEATCYDGQCITYDNMCKTLWGSVSKQGIDSCYEYNVQGKFYGNCGSEKNGDDETYFKCKLKDIKCGKLFCEGGPTYPIIGSLVRSQVLNAYDENFQLHKCKTASVDFGTDVPDPGLVVDGAKCAPNSVCSNFECKNLTELGITPCPNNCLGRGVCNSNNNCHCNKDWAPPLCRDPGNGGSIDSGPARPPQPIFPFHPTRGFVDDKVTITIPIVESEVDTRVTSTIPLLGNGVESTGKTSKGSIVVIMVMLLVVLPLIMLILFVAYWKRDVIQAKWKTLRNQYPQPKHSNHKKQLRKPVTAPGQSLSIEHKVPLAQKSYLDNQTNSGYSSGYSSKHSSSSSAASDIPSYPMNFTPATATVEFTPVRPAPVRPAPPRPVPAKPSMPARPYPPPSNNVKPSAPSLHASNSSNWKNNRVPPKLPALRPTYANTNNSASSSVPISPIKPPPPVKPPPPANIANKPRVPPKPSAGKPVVQVKPKPRPRSSVSSPFV